MQLLGEQNGWIKWLVCICLLRSCQTISQSSCTSLYSHQHFLQRLNPPKACLWIFQNLDEWRWLGLVLSLNLPVSNTALHPDIYCASLIPDFETLGLNFSIKQIHFLLGGWRKGKSLVCMGSQKETQSNCSCTVQWQSLILKVMPHPPQGYQTSAVFEVFHGWKRRISTFIIVIFLNIHLGYTSPFYKVSYHLNHNSMIITFKKRT